MAVRKSGGMLLRMMQDSIVFEGGYNHLHVGIKDCKCLKVEKQPPNTLLLTVFDLPP